MAALWTETKKSFGRNFVFWACASPITGRSSAWRKSSLLMNSDAAGAFSASWRPTAASVFTPPPSSCFSVWQSFSAFLFPSYLKTRACLKNALSCRRFPAAFLFCSHDRYYFVTFCFYFFESFSVSSCWTLSYFVLIVLQIIKHLDKMPLYIVY